MSKVPFSHSDSFVLAAAMLSARGNNQRATAARLNVTQGTIARGLPLATAKRWYNPLPTVIFRNVPPEVLTAANDRLAEARCHPTITRLAPKGHACRVWAIHERSPRAFNAAAADTVITHVLEASVLGVAWGRAVAAVVDGLDAAFPTAPRGRRPDSPPLHAIPVCGEPLRVATTLHEFSSSLLATRIGEIFNLERPRVPSLAGVPAYIPRKLGDAARRTVRAFFGEVPDYRAVVGEDGLLTKMDTLLTGIGVPDAAGAGDPHGVFVAERTVSEGLTSAEMARLVYGDLAGVLIPRRDLSAGEVATVQSLNDGWTGLRLEDIERCAREANERGHGGVIVISQHGRKRNLVRELVRRGLVNHLVIDEQLDDELSQ